eukprot:m.38197 g.38197  ORF g.38197 m.38197 type:complete len:325 (+) comp9941_c0_seq2:14-988(+)
MVHLHTFTQRKNRETLLATFRMSKKHMLLAGSALYMAAAGAGYVYFSRNKEPFSSNSAGVGAPQNTDKTWAELAKTYDERVGTDELLIGMTMLRRLLCRHAHGDVLEVAVGTGRNLSYLTDKASTLTLTDRNGPMLSVALEKLGVPTSQQATAPAITTTVTPSHSPSLTSSSASPASPSLTDSTVTSTSSWEGFSKVGANKTPLRARVASVEQLPFSDNSFDTVVDTFGLCSCVDPVVALREIQRVCRPDGVILLLEHGRSDYNWMTRLLDANADKHAATWGCWWNRDIRAAIATADLVVETLYTWHFGTTYYIIARPHKSSSS